VNIELLRKHISHYRSWLASNPEEAKAEIKERAERRAFYQSWTRQKLAAMSMEDISKYLADLWAMRMWGNRQHRVDKIVAGNGLDVLRAQLADLMWGEAPLAKRWDAFRAKISRVGPAMMSEMLCHTHPEKCLLWNRRALVAFQTLGVDNPPRHDYQLTGKKYEDLTKNGHEIAAEMSKAGIKDFDLLSVDYFIWRELQPEGDLTSVIGTAKTSEPVVEKVDKPTAEFIHNEVRDKLGEIGDWLGFDTDTEVRVADGAKVDASWEATIGNLGRVIYVFEVQTKGSIDSLLMNLLKSLNNPAVQGAVAVSDAKQLEVIRKEAKAVAGLRDKLKYWDYQEVLAVHEALRGVNESINRLGLVPDSF